MKTIASLFGFGAAFLIATNIHAQTVVYQNTTTDTGNNLSLLNGQIEGTEILLSVPGADLTDFSFEIYSPEEAFIGTPEMEVWLYSNDGTAYNGYATPSTVDFDSGTFSLETPYASSGGLSYYGTLDSGSLSDVSVPNDITLAVEVTGLAEGDSVGLELFDPATVGSNYGDYWLNDGSGWALYTNATPTAVGMQLTGTPTPEPTPVWIGVIGIAFLALGKGRKITSLVSSR